MERAVIDGVTLEYGEAGAGDAVVCIHGVLIADAFRPLLSERELTDRHRVLYYHRRGYVGSSPAETSMGVGDQAGDCLRLLSYLGIERAHVVGHSGGGVVALQLALDAPKVVHTLSLLEAGVVIGASAPSYREALTNSIRRSQEAGTRAAVAEFLQKRWPEYEEALDDALPGAFEQAVGDAATCFEVELPAALSWHFGEEEARRITQPALVVLGERSVALDPRFAETYRLLLSWLPNAEGFVVPAATHLLPIESPALLAGALAAFFSRHALHDSS